MRSASTTPVKGGLCHHRRAMPEVTLAEPDAAWPVLAAQMADELRAACATSIGPGPVEVAHIGSTAVPGLCAKPVIDLLLGVTELSQALDAHDALARLGYVYRPEHEAQIPGRRYFVRPAGATPRVHLHAVVRGGPLWRQHVLLRDRLRDSTALRDDYAALKRALAVTHAHDKAAYTQAKAPFIRGVLGAAAEAVDVTPALVDDAEGIAQVHVRTWQAAYAGIVAAAFLDGLSVARRAVQWRDILPQQASQTFVARRGGAVAGFVSTGPWRDAPEAADHGEIWALYVAPAAWGSGLAQALMDVALRTLRAQGRTTVSLWVLSRNARAIRFYAGVGFAPVAGSTKTFDLGGAPVDEVCLRRGPV